MIESYAFLAMFVLQILVMSVLLPFRIIWFAREKASQIPAERIAQAYPGLDYHKTSERYITWYRALNLGIALLGLWPLAWFVSYTARPDWDDGPVEGVGAAYLMVQVLPLLILAFFAVKYGKQIRKNFSSGKRTAVLERRGLFDFVSPFTVAAAILSYFLLVAYVIHIARNPFPGFAGPYVNIGMFTLLYAFLGFGAYKLLHGKASPLESHEDRVYGMGLGVRACVYGSIAFAVNISINFTLVLLDQQRWEPFAGSAGLLLNALLIFMVFTARPRRPDADGLGASPAS